MFLPHKATEEQQRRSNPSLTAERWRSARRQERGMSDALQRGTLCSRTRTTFTFYAHLFTANTSVIVQDNNNKTKTTTTTEEAALLLLLLNYIHDVIMTS